MTDTLLVVDLQDALNEDEPDKPPSSAELIKWANRAYGQIADTSSEVTLRLVSEAEMEELNASYRGKQGSTNVLSFPFESDFNFDAAEAADSQNVGVVSDFAPALLGDIVICHAVIRKESIEQNKSLEDHYAHMVTHGVLHLCGYDHIDESSAEQMEALEVEILAHSNIENPYT